MKDYNVTREDLQRQLNELSSKIDESKDNLMSIALQLRELKIDWHTNLPKLSHDEEKRKRAHKEYQKNTEKLQNALREAKKLLRDYAEMHAECDKQLLDVDSHETQIVLLQQALEANHDANADTDAVLEEILTKNKLVLRELIAKKYWDNKLSMPERGDVDFDMSDTSVNISVRTSYDLDPDIAKLATSLGIVMDDVENLIDRQMHIKELFDSTLKKIINADELEKRKSEIMDLAAECHYANDFVEKKILHAKKVWLKQCIEKFAKGEKKHGIEYLYQKGAELSVSHENIDEMVQRLQKVEEAQKGENDLINQIKQANKKPFLITWLSIIPFVILEIIFAGGWSVLLIAATAGIAWCVTKIISIKNEIMIRKIEGGFIAYFKTHAKNKGQKEVDQMKKDANKYINDTIGLEHKEQNNDSDE